jgi:hypothetical protein
VRLREPAWLFAAIGVLLIFAIGYAFCAWAASGMRGVDPNVAQGLLWPAAIGAGLGAGMIGGRLRRGLVIHRRDAVLRATMAGAAAGFAWPVSFGVAVLLQGDVRSFLGSFAIGLTGALIGAAAGAVGGGAASLVCLRR